MWLKSFILNWTPAYFICRIVWDFSFHQGWWVALTFRHYFSFPVMKLCYLAVLIKYICHWLLLMQVMWWKLPVQINFLSNYVIEKYKGCVGSIYESKDTLYYFISLFYKVRIRRGYMSVACKSIINPVSSRLWDRWLLLPSKCKLIFYNEHPMWIAAETAKL